MLTDRLGFIVATKTVHQWTEFLQETQIHDYPQLKTLLGATAASSWAEQRLLAPIRSNSKQERTASARLADQIDRL